MKSPLIIILLGPPGAGKGTHAIKLCKDLNIPHISTGEILRENIRQNTELGKKAKEYIEQGKLVPDDLVLDILFDRVQKKDCAHGYLLDGFPRTLPQAESFHKKIHGKVLVLNIQIPDILLIERLSNRYVCEKCFAPYNLLFSPPKRKGLCDRCGANLYQREDDKEDVIKNRLKVYRKQTEPLIAYYEKKKLLKDIDNTGSIDDSYVFLKKTVTDIV